MGNRPPPPDPFRAGTIFSVIRYTARKITTHAFREPEHLPSWEPEPWGLEGNRIRMSSHDLRHQAQVRSATAEIVSRGLTQWSRNHRTIAYIQTVVDFLPASPKRPVPL